VRVPRPHGQRHARLRCSVVSAGVREGQFLDVTGPAAPVRKQASRSRATRRLFGTTRSRVLGRRARARLPMIATLAPAEGAASNDGVEAQAVARPCTQKRRLASA